MFREFIDKNSTPDSLILLCLFLVGLGLRLIRLFELDVWFDEVVLLFMVKHPFLVIWELCKTDNFPPLFPWLLKLWNSVFPGENSLRFFSALMGALTPPAAYLLGKELLNRKLGLLLGFSCLISVSLVFHSQMIRMYSLFPLFSCLSFIGFIRGLKTNSWKSWILMAAANVLGFYTFLFMVFLVAWEFIALVWWNRHRIKGIIRPLLTHLPVAVLISAWMAPLYHRYGAVQQSFALMDFSIADLFKLWAFLGTGTYFGDHYWVVFLLNLPFLVGFIASIGSWKRNVFLRLTASSIIGIVGIVALISISGQSIFMKRYFIFLLPVHLALVLAGWLQLKSRFYSAFGVGITLLSLVISALYYYSNFYAVHDRSGYTLPYATAESEAADGHALSRVDAYITARISEDEVVIHYSRPTFRILTFFPSLYYNRRLLPEYIFSSYEIPPWNGGQYLLPHERIQSLYDLDPLPSGIWLISLDSTDVFLDAHFEDRLLNVSDRTWKWVLGDNLPRELRETGFTPIETFKKGNVSATHLRR